MYKSAAVAALLQLGVAGIVVSITEPGFLKRVTAITSLVIYTLFIVGYDVATAAVYVAMSQRQGKSALPITVFVLELP